MVKVNIPKSVDDPTYRYKRDKIEIVIQNSHGGLTKLINIDKIGEQLGLPVNDILKFIKKKACVNIIDKDGVFIRKVETVDNIENYLEDFIKMEVLCPKCKNPEFSIIEEKKNTTKTCKACGHNRS